MVQQRLAVAEAGGGSGGGRAAEAGGGGCLHGTQRLVEMRRAVRVVVWRRQATKERLEEEVQRVAEAATKAGSGGRQRAVTEGGGPANAGRGRQQEAATEVEDGR